MFLDDDEVMTRGARFWNHDFGATHEPRFWCHPTIVSDVNVQTKIFVPECREAAIGSSPGWSDDELSESSETRGLLHRLHRFQNPSKRDPFANPESGVTGQSRSGERRPR